MACHLRGLWIFRADNEVKLMTSRRFPTVEKRVEILLGNRYTPLPNDEEINLRFLLDVLYDRDCLFGREARSSERGAFVWRPEQEQKQEKVWPLGPICSLHPKGGGLLWPAVFLAKKGFYLFSVVALLDPHISRGSPPGGESNLEAIDLPEVTSAFVVLEDIADFISPELSITDVGAIAELQYYLKAALPFGSPVNTNYSLLRKVRTMGFSESNDLLNVNNQQDSTKQPSWKPYLANTRRSKLMLSIVETVTCTIYGKPEFQDECFIHGTVYCSAELPGVPEVCVPLHYGNLMSNNNKSNNSYSGSNPAAGVTRAIAANGLDSPSSTTGGANNSDNSAPQICVYNCAQLLDNLDNKTNEMRKISCIPPTTPFVLCRYRYPSVTKLPIRGFYQVKEVSPVELRLLLQIEFDKDLVQKCQPQCQLRLPFGHRGAIRASRLQCSSGSNFTIEKSPDSHSGRGGSASGAGQGGSGENQKSDDTIVWHIRKVADSLEASLIGELVFDAENTDTRNTEEVINTCISSFDESLVYAQTNLSNVLTSCTAVNSGKEGKDHSSSSHHQSNHDSNVVGGTKGQNVGGGHNNTCVGHNGGGHHGGGHNGNLLGDGYILDSGGTNSIYDGEHIVNPNHNIRNIPNPVEDGGNTAGIAQTGMNSADRYDGGNPGAGSGSNNGNGEKNSSSSTATGGPGSTTSDAKKSDFTPSGDPFLRGTTCYCEVFMRLPEHTFSGIGIDPKGVTVYPSQKLPISIQNEVVTGRYIIWNSAGSVKAHHMLVD